MQKFLLTVASSTFWKSSNSQQCHLILSWQDASVAFFFFIFFFFFYDSSFAFFFFIFFFFVFFFDSIFKIQKIFLLTFGYCISWLVFGAYLFYVTLTWDILSWTNLAATTYSNIVDFVHLYPFRRYHFS